jgi:hypothetical protein
MTLKYSEETYLNCGFWGGDESESNHTQRIVMIRKEHICSGCFKPSGQGAKMLRETAVLQDIGRKSCYTCLVCLNRWIDQHPQLVIAEK